MVKKFLKNTRLGIRFSYWPTYQRFRNPEHYQKQQEEAAFYQRMLEGLDNDLIFDVGANVGRKSYLFSRIAKRVLAFEPSERGSRILKGRFEGTNVDVFSIALGRSKSVMDYFEIEADTAFSTLSRKHIETTVRERGVADPGSLRSRKVETNTLESFVEEYGTPSYIKIDVEGHEVEVIHGLMSPVPLLSFESNLPEFLDETIECLEYLSSISDGRYSFNACPDDTSLLFDSPLSKEGMIDFLRSTELRYLEVYSRLE